MSTDSKRESIIPQNGRTLETSLDVDHLWPYRLRKNDFCEKLTALFTRHGRRSFRENFVLLRRVARRVSTLTRRHGQREGGGGGAEKKKNTNGRVLHE